MRQGEKKRALCVCEPEARAIEQKNIRLSYQLSDSITAERFSAAYNRWAAVLFF
jgi:hypothetical protein